MENHSIFYKLAFSHVCTTIVFSLRLTITLTIFHNLSNPTISNLSSSADIWSANIIFLIVFKSLVALDCFMRVTDS